MANMPHDISNLEQLLERIDKAATDQERISLRMIIEAVGDRSFGPLLLMAGVILVSPLSGIPGMPTLMGTLVLLIAVQLLFHRRHFWLPQWLLKRSIPRKQLCKALQWLQTPARFVDRWLRPRLSLFIRGPSRYVIAIICIVISFCMPILEVLPFSATTAGVALTAFGLALIALDGLLALLAFLVTTTILTLIVYKLL